MDLTKNRSAIIDWLRAFAIFLMIIYHFSYDLSSFHFIESATFEGVFLTFIGRLCLCLFMFCVGYSLAMSHPDQIHWKSFFRRWLKIACSAGLVSLGTYLAFPQYWIYFGILHCIAVSSIFVLPFLRFPLLALFAGIVMMLVYWFWPQYLLQYLPWFQLNRPALDYIPPFPWMGPALIGIGFHRFEIHKRWIVKQNKAIEWLSRHSLEIYLVHQPVLYGLVLLLAKWKNPVFFP